MLKLILLLLAILILNITSGYSQVGNDSIEVIKTKSKAIVFSQHGERLTPKQLTNIIKDNPAAYKELRAAKTNQVFGTIFSYAGGYLIGYPIGMAITGGKPVWGLAGIGAGLFAVSIPFSSASAKRTRSAVGQYNSGLGSAGLQKVNLRWGITPGSMAFILSF